MSAPDFIVRMLNIGDIRQTRVLDMSGPDFSLLQHVMRAQGLEQPAVPLEEAGEPPAGYIEMPEPSAALVAPEFDEAWLIDACGASNFLDALSNAMLAAKRIRFFEYRDVFASTVALFTQVFEEAGWTRELVVSGISHSSSHDGRFCGGIYSKPPE